MISFFLSLFKRTLKALIQERSTFITHRGEILLSGNLLERKWYVFLYLIFMVPQRLGMRVSSILRNITGVGVAGAWMGRCKHSGKQRKTKLRFVVKDCCCFVSFMYIKLSDNNETVTCHVCHYDWCKKGLGFIAILSKKICHDIKSVQYRCVLVSETKIEIWILNWGTQFIIIWNLKPEQVQPKACGTLLDSLHWSVFLGALPGTPLWGWHLCQFHTQPERSPFPLL